MENKPVKPQPTYSDSFKLGVIARVVNGQMTKEQARIEFGIGGKSSILEWMKKYGYPTDSPSQPAMTKPAEKNDPDELKKKVRQLEKQLQTERIRSEFYRTMIDVAERELGISIEKKSGTNPSD
jgi:transposase-like protein